MSKIGRDDLEATAKEYVENRAATMRENRIRMQELNIESKKKALDIEAILQDCGLRKSKPTKARNKNPKTTETDLIIGRESLRPRAASIQTQNDENLGDHLEEVNEGQAREWELRKFTRKETIWARANENKPLIKMEFNKLGQPVGEGAKEFPAIITTLIRTKKFPLNASDWRDIDVEHKDKLIDDISVLYEMDEQLQNYALLKAAKNWRAFKADLKKAAKFDATLTYEELIERRDPRVDLEDWKWLVKHWLSEEGQERSERAKKSHSKVITPHTTGSKSFARAGYEWSKELGRDLRRDELFMRTHTRKDGLPLKQALAKITELRTVATKRPELVEKNIEEGDLFAHVFGRDPRGYVRGVGLGPTPSSLGIAGHRKCTSTKVVMANHGRHRVEEQNTLLKDALSQLFDEVRELREAVKAGQRDQVGIEDATDRVSVPTPEHGSNPTPPVVREVANDHNEHELDEEVNNSPHVEVIMNSRRRALLQLPTRHEGGGKDVILLSTERPCDQPVAKATLQTTDPEARVGGCLLGYDCYEVVVHSVMRGDHLLPRQYGKLKTLADSIGRSIAWPYLNVLTEERAAKQAKLQQLQQGQR